MIKYISLIEQAAKTSHGIVNSGIVEDLHRHPHIKKMQKQSNLPFVWMDSTVPGLGWKTHCSCFQSEIILDLRKQNASNIQPFKKETSLPIRMLNTNGLALINNSFIVKAIYASDEWINKRPAKATISFRLLQKSVSVQCNFFYKKRKEMYEVFSNACFLSVNIKDVHLMGFFFFF